MNKNTFLSYLILLLIVVSVMLPILSWMLSALGINCKSLLSEEGFRWIFYHLPIVCANKWNVLCITSVIGIGGVMRSGILDRKENSDIKALYTVSIVLVLLVALLMVCALHPHSPLLSVTGEVRNSPFIHGLPIVFIWCDISFVCVCASDRSYKDNTGFLGYAYLWYSQVPVVHCHSDAAVLRHTLRHIHI